MPEEIVVVNLALGVLASASCILGLRYLAMRREFRHRVAEDRARRETEGSQIRLLELVSDAVLRADARGRIAYASPGISWVLGYTPGEIAGRDASSLFHPDAPLIGVARESEPIREALGSVQRQVFPARHKDGSVRWVEAHNRSVVDADSGDVVEIASVLRDVSERRWQEDRSRRQGAALARAACAATAAEVATTLRHELNQPLAAIGNHLEALKRAIGTRDPEEPALEDVAAALVQLHRAGSIVHGLRRYVERQELRREPAGFDALVRDSLRLVEVELRSLGIRCQLELGSGDAPVDVDATRIQHALVSLIMLAAQLLRSEPAGPCELVVRTSDPGDGTAGFVVRGGSGEVSPEEIDRIASPFFETPLPLHGLALAASRRTIEQHGGTLDASRNGDGAVALRMTLPRGKAGGHAT